MMAGLSSTEVECKEDKEEEGYVNRPRENVHMKKTMGGRLRMMRGWSWRMKKKRCLYTTSTSS
jgi:hypothetical protein